MAPEMPEEDLPYDDYNYDEQPDLEYDDHDYS